MELDPHSVIASRRRRNLFPENFNKKIRMKSFTSIVFLICCGFTFVDGTNPQSLFELDQCSPEILKVRSTRTGGGIFLGSF